MKRRGTSTSSNARGSRRLSSGENDGTPPEQSSEGAALIQSKLGLPPLDSEEVEVVRDSCLRHERNDCLRRRRGLVFPRLLGDRSPLPPRGDGPPDSSPPPLPSAIASVGPVVRCLRRRQQRHPRCHCRLLIPIAFIYLDLRIHRQRSSFPRGIIRGGHFPLFPLDGSIPASLFDLPVEDSRGPTRFRARHLPCRIAYGEDESHLDGTQE